MTAEQATAGQAPEGYEVYAPHMHTRGEKPMLLRVVPVLTSEDLADVAVERDKRTTEAVINFRFNQQGARTFGRFTTDNIGQPFAIVVDGRILSAPVIPQRNPRWQRSDDGNVYAADGERVGCKVARGRGACQSRYKERSLIAP